MARQQKVDMVFTDDLTGDVLTQDQLQTMTFAVDGATYEIDLSEKNASSLRNDFAAWVEHARKINKGKAAGRRTTTIAPPRTDRQQSAKIQEWAQDNGHAVSQRGRIPATLIHAYNAAH